MSRYFNRMLSVFLILVLLAVVLPSGRPNWVSASERDRAPYTSEQFYEILRGMNIPTESLKGRPVNWDTFVKYELIVYGSPWGDYKNGEYRYLGYTWDDREFTNHNFPDDATPTRPPETWNFVVVDEQGKSWEGPTPDQIDQLETATLIGHGATTLTVKDYLGRQKAKVQAPPTLMSYGSIYTRHLGLDGKLYYATFLVPPLPGSIDINLTYSYPSEVVVPADVDSVTVPITVTASASPAEDVKSSAVFLELDPGGTGFGPHSIFKIKTSDTNSVSYTYEHTFSREQYSPGTYNVPLRFTGAAASVYNDIFRREAPGSILLTVEEAAPEPGGEPTAYFWCKSQVIIGEDIGYKDTSTAPEGEEIVERVLTIKDPNGEVIDTRSGSTSYSISFYETGTYELSLIVKSSSGVWSAPYTRNVTVTEKPEPPPSDMEPYIDLWFEERTDIPGIPVDEVYEGEDILIMAEVEGGFDWRWRVRSQTGGSINERGDGLINGLYRTYEPDERVEARQRADYYVFEWQEAEDGSGSWVQVEKTVEETKNFKVKYIEPPVVEIITDMNPDGFNLARIGEELNIATNMYDPNSPSQQHPYGFPIAKSWSFIEKSTGRVALEGAGEFADENFVLERGVFRPDETYIFRAEAVNEFKPERRAEKEFEFFVENRFPELELSLEMPDENRPLFVFENFKFRIKARDIDGNIEHVSVELQNADGKLVELGRSIIKPLGGEEYEAVIEYTSNAAVSSTFKVTVTDDCGADTTVYSAVSIIEPTVTAVINIENEAEIQKKEYRYMQLDAFQSYTNGPFGIHQERFEWKYRFGDGDWTVISGGQNFSNDEIRVHFPYYPHTSLMQMYPKKAGELSFSLRAQDTKGFASEEAVKTVTIAQNLPPKIDFNIEAAQHRITERDIAEHSGTSAAITDENLNRAYIGIRDGTRSVDGDRLKYKEFYIVYDGRLEGPEGRQEYVTRIEEREDGFGPGEEILVDVEGDRTVYVRDINNFNLTYLTDLNALGNYYIRAKAEEENIQLPPENSPLYSEIAGIGLSSVSDYSTVFIDNIRPEVTFVVGQEKEINLLIHFDGNIDDTANAKINELVNRLESMGFKINLIKYENRY